MQNCHHHHKVNTTPTPTPPKKKPRTKTTTTKQQQQNLASMCNHQKEKDKTIPRQLLGEMLSLG